ncbi:hypothetical protein TNCV_4833771 [Trichonephila clavipes]|nr:hypothetical protein TNCV_4833771 [Trichonephila clavipes]
MQSRIMFPWKHQSGEMSVIRDGKVFFSAKRGYLRITPSTNAAKSKVIAKCCHFTCKQDCKQFCTCSGYLYKPVKASGQKGSLLSSGYVTRLRIYRSQALSSRYAPPLRRS